jgi:pyochelin biosynthesis protein PchC
MNPSGTVDLKAFPPLREGNEASPTRIIFCAPAAGTGARGFLAPHARAPFRRSLRVVQLPGREDRCDEAFLDDIVDIGTLVARAVYAAADQQCIEDLALFGHSFGALVMLEAVREIERMGGMSIAVLAVAACAPPNLPMPFDVERLGTADIAETLSDLGGLDFTRPGGRDLAAIILPTLAADIRACARYLSVAGTEPVATPIVAMNGSLDRAVTATKMAAWRPYTKSSFTQREYPGGHFFPRESELPLQALMDWPAATDRSVSDR